MRRQHISKKKEYPLKIIYPLEKSKWGLEIKYSIASLHKNLCCDFDLYIFGDHKPEIDFDLEYIKFEKKSRNKEKNQFEGIKWFMDQFDDFVIVHDDMYILRPIGPETIKHHDYLAAFESYETRKKGIWRKKLWATHDALRKNIEGPIYNYSTHTPYYYVSDNIRCLMHLYPGLDTGDLLIGTLYYNHFPSDGAKQIDNKVGFYDITDDISFGDAVFLNHDDAGLSDALKAKIENYF